MYYKVKKSSPTGKKFNTLMKDIDKANAAALKLMKELGGTMIRREPFAIGGTIMSIRLDPNMREKTGFKKLKKGHNEYIPHPTTKEGKFIQSEINDLPRVVFADLNKIVNCDEILSNIGFYPMNEKYFLLNIDSAWNVVTPSDCVELKESDYEKLKK